MHRYAYPEKPVGYIVTPETCVFRWCTAEAIGKIMVQLPIVQEDDNAYILIPVCVNHRTMVEKAKEKAKIRD